MAALNNPLPPPAFTSSTRVSSETVERAVDALLKWIKLKQKSQLLEQDDFLYLILNLKKIPPSSRTNPFKIPLPNPLHSPDEEELCLIIDDRSTARLTSDAAQKKIKAENIPVSKVLKLSKLKSEYRPFEAKRKLYDSFNLFFADKRIIPLLPRFLGKQFFKKKKIPVPVDLTHKNWKEQIENACGSALLCLGTGTCSVVKVARVSQDRDKIVANVVAAIDGVAEIVPKKWGNVRSLHLKLCESLALPVYQSVPGSGLKIEGVKKKEEETKEEMVVGLESLDGGKVEDKERKLERQKRLQKGRIHEVRYMDSNLDELLHNDELGSNVGINDGAKNGNCDLGNAELKGKKRKSGKKEQVLNELNSEKRRKKPAKVKKGEAVKK